ncbi:MTAP family purine nucleoside phosphorylase [Ereboglobus luteus]|uniref:Purine phosphorylase n=1 Tax=Ereboglobus luteus TaxID=1796921 RepID=A0A2U8E6U0_9BACT|nr:MTAP family purine nucleoside phosphorylase [Ereboglobus luteus]AWI10551.1 purine phosphorylase [Ereboglobus luteus]
MKVAFVSGTSIVNSDLFSEWEARSATTKYGTVGYKARGEHVILNRHGTGVPKPPHAINYRANIRALADLGFTDVVSLNSVGSLRLNLTPGTIVSCGDYVCLQDGPRTFFDDELRGGSAGIDNNLIPMLVEKLAPEFEIQTGKVYVQMRGPRFETKAEIQILKNWGDVVGMTAAHEADLCSEIGLRYNSLAIIDNYANGLAGEEIDFIKFKDLVRDNQIKVNRLFARLLEVFA